MERINEILDLLEEEEMRTICAASVATMFEESLSNAYVPGEPMTNMNIAYYLAKEIEHILETNRRVFQALREYELILSGALKEEIA